MVAQAPPVPPTVTVQRSCYAEGDTIALSGRGFTPGGAVRLTLERARQAPLVNTTAPQADQGGYVEGTYGVTEETGWFGRTERRFRLRLRLTDVLDPSRTAAASFLFSRWNVGVRSVSGRIDPRRRVELRAVGFTGSAGKPLYAHWVRNGRSVVTVRLGVLKGPCGDLRATLGRGFPFRPVLPGTWHVTFNTSRTNPRARDTIVVRAPHVKRTIP